MNFFERLLLFLQGTMNTPKAFGYFHMIWIVLTIVSIILLYRKRTEKNLKTVWSERILPPE